METSVKLESDMTTFRKEWVHHVLEKYAIERSWAARSAFSPVNKQQKCTIAP
jgi:hypothetical protein